MLSELVRFLESLGWVANLIAVAGAAVALWAYLHNQPKWIRDLRNRRRFNRVLPFVETRLPERADVVASLRGQARIAVVDDSPGDFPIEYLRQAGFRIDVFEQLSLAEVSRLAGYHVVLLDIAGVVPQDPMRGGLLLISRLKEQPKGPSVIAVSGLTFDPTVTEFFRKADDVMKKPISPIECEERLSQIIEERLSPYRAAANVDAIAVQSRSGAADQAIVARLLIAYLQERCPKDRLQARLEDHLSAAQAKEAIEQLERVRSWL